MKRLLIVAALLLQTVAWTGASRAQSGAEEARYLQVPHRFQLFVEAGGSRATGPSVWSEYWNPGFQFGIGGGMSIFPWLEINAGLTTSSAALDAFEAKRVIRYQGLSAVEGGKISTTIFYSSARFIGVPKSRTNPYVEVAVGYFKTSAEDVFIENASPSGDLVNSMDGVSGLSLAPSAGVQYALGDHWGAYVRYTYTVNLAGDFAPGELIQPINGTREEPVGNQVIQTLVVGLMLRF